MNKLNVFKAGLVKRLLEQESGYKEFFDAKLKSYGVKSQSELSEDQKKKFFDEVDAEWKAKKEED